MQSLIYMLIFFPLLFAFTMPFTSVRIRFVTTLVYISFLIFITSKIVLNEALIRGSFSHLLHYIFICTDFLLFGYFIYQGIKYKHKLVVLLAFFQVLLFVFVLQFSPSKLSTDILVDELSRVMLLIVNVVGGVIIIYALKYMQSEELKECKKGLFIGILFFFLGVMNFAVTTNNIELFFLTFELTTFCSYILIRFRMDETAIKNALQALWINQLGGIAILFALLFGLYQFESYYFDILINESAGIYLASFAFLVIAAMIKGASIPFERWLLGAMVAPTPVSAILHSATMVKIAPYLVLKITPALSSSLSLAVVLFGSFVFMSASLMALSRDFFKEILGLSTIALLALMVAIGAIGTDESYGIVLILIVFHAVSKALLFLQAGIMEKQFHFKYLSDINGLVSFSKPTVVFIIIGFASLTLPPFGVFVGKFLTIQILADLIKLNILYIIPLVFLLIGSVVLTLLYFKVITKFLVKTTLEITEPNPMPLTFTFTSLILVVLLFAGMFQLYFMGSLELYEFLIPLIIIILCLLLIAFTSYNKAHRVKEYNCGEKESVEIEPFYFRIRDKYLKKLQYISIAAMTVILIIGLINV